MRETEHRLLVFLIVAAASAGVGYAVSNTRRPSDTASSPAPPPLIVTLPDTQTTSAATVVSVVAGFAVGIACLVLLIILLMHSQEIRELERVALERLHEAEGRLAESLKRKPRKRDRAHKGPSPPSSAEKPQVRPPRHFGIPRNLRHDWHSPGSKRPAPSSVPSSATSSPAATLGDAEAAGASVLGSSSRNLGHLFQEAAAPESPSGDPHVRFE